VAQILESWSAFGIRFLAWICPLTSGTSPLSTW
jgi:hypothetical protein